jgi:hypothetical protein
VDSAETSGVANLYVGYCDSYAAEKFTYGVRILVGLWSLSTYQILRWVDSEALLKVSGQSKNS